MSEKTVDSRRSMLMQRLRENGPSGFNKQELVELLMVYSSRKNTTEAATGKLFDYFGSMSEILEAPVMELTQLEGISRNSAVLLSMIPQVARRVSIDRAVRKNLKGIEEIRNFIPNCFIGKTVEYFLLVCLDKNQKMIRYDFVSKGTVNSSSVDLRKIVHLLLVTNAAYAVIAHNHPRGHNYPSRDDLKTTQVIVNALSKIDVKLLDHIIVSSRGDYSIAEAPSDIRCCMQSD
ncbi:MAG: hypothetical protein IJM51_04750 [Clostridia bacterium]|nr:hypothetical protein [Clostridia bacterium]